MDDVRNPFASFGGGPSILVGREPALQLVEGVVTRLSAGASCAPVLFAGRTGVGTSAILGAVPPRVAHYDWYAGIARARPDEPLRDAVGRAFARALGSLASRRPGAVAVRAASDAVAAFAPRAAGDLPVTPDPHAYAESPGDLARDLRRVFSRVGDALGDLVGRGLVVTLDDLHAADAGDAVALISCAAAAMRDGLPIGFVAAGTPTLRWLAGVADAADAPVDVAPLDAAGVTELVRTLAARAGGGIDDVALAAISRATAGYPQLVLVYAEAAWDAAEGPIVTAADVEAGAAAARERLAERVLGPSFAVSAAARRYLRAVAEVDDPADSALIARRLGDTTRFGGGGSQLTELRDVLVRRGLLVNLDGARLTFAHPAARSYVLSWE